MSTTIAIFLLLCVGSVLIALPYVRFRELREMIGALTERIATLERKLQRSERPPAPEKAAIPPSPLLATPRRGELPLVQELRQQIPPGARPAVPPPLPPPLPPTLPPKTPFNWEAFMGVKLFAWLGGLALFLGVVFMVKYSFENNLITPLGRLVIGGTMGRLWLRPAGGWHAVAIGPQRRVFAPPGSSSSTPIFLRRILFTRSFP